MDKTTCFQRIRPAAKLLLLVITPLSGCSPANSCHLAAGLAPTAEALRGLKFARPLDCSVEPGSIVTRLAGGDSAAGKMPNHSPTADFGKSLRRQLLFDPAAPGAEETLNRNELAPEMIRGAYSFREKKLILGAGVAQHQLEQTVVHELVHALQDQHFDLASLLEPPTGTVEGGAARRSDSDQQLARFSLIEGDAVLDEYRYRYPNTDVCSAAGLDRLIATIPTAENPGLSSYPSFSLYRREFSNRYGLRFICLETKQGKSRNDLFLNPPKSSAEIMFIGKTGAGIGQKPATKSCSDTGADQNSRDSELRFSDRFGLAGLIYLLGPDKSGELSGFIGDCAGLYRRTDGGIFAVWSIEFSTSEQAAKVSSMLQGRFHALGSALGRTDSVSKWEFRIKNGTIYIATPPVSP